MRLRVAMYLIGTVERNLNIPAEGYHVFGIVSNGKVSLSVAGRPMIDNDGAGGRAQRAFVVPLRRGVYPMRVEFEHVANAGDIDILVFQCKEGEPEAG